MKVRNIFLVGVAAVLLCSCAQKRTDTETRQKARQLELGDSIAAITQEIDSCKEQVAILNDKVNGLLPQFETVANPREVGSYTILRTFKNAYPLKQTGLLARINDSQQFELVAALKGGAFDHITVIAPDISVSSDVVPHDQALNYNDGELTTVSFTGEKADEIGQVIADNLINNIRINFHQGSRLVLSWNVPAKFANEIAATYILYNCQKESNRLSRREQMLHEKINILRTHRE